MLVIPLVTQRSAKAIRTLCIGSFTLLAATVTLNAQAGDASTEKQASAASTQESQDGFTASFGFGVGRNSLTGTSDKAKAFPLFSVDWQSGQFFAGLSRGAGYNWVQNEVVTFSTAITAVGGRREKDSSRFKGLGNVKSSLASNITVKWTPNGASFAFTAAVTEAFGKGLGSAFNFGIASDCPLSDKLSLNASLSANYADKKRMQSLYGVTALQASGSVYSVFTTKGGIESADAVVGLDYALDKKWVISGNIGVNRLQGEAGKSLIFKDKTSAVGALTATYRF